jgi:hypothetical protein
MGKNKNLSRDQKRKAKLAKRAKRSGPFSSLAYSGRKYKTDELVPVFFRTETGIYEAFVMRERKLTDRDVEAALEELIGQMRRGPLPPLDQTKEAQAAENGEGDFIIWNIRRNWKELFATERHPVLNNRIGVLRTILDSIRIRSSPGPTARGYLHYIEGFLKKQGYTFEGYSEDGQPLEQAEENALHEVGEEWCETRNPEMGEEFKSLAEKMIRTGEAEEVVEICQDLMGGKPAPEIINELSALSIWAQGKLHKQPG